MMQSHSSLMPIDEALERILGVLEPGGETQVVSLSEALGAVLAGDQRARIAVPAHDNSAMDGFALNTPDLDAGQRSFPVTQTIAAGHPGAPLESGTAARIFTGGVIPEGADTVVIQENVRQADGMIEVLEVPRPGANIRLRGHDIMQGEVALNAGQRLRPQDLGLLSSLGISRIETFRPLRVALVNTGDEVVMPDQPLGPGQIYDSNGITLEGLLRSMGIEVQRPGVVEDTLDATREHLDEAARKADCIISTGGVSVGDEDHVRSAVESLGYLQLWKLAIKPGKPFAFGQVGDKPFFGLPGNPVAVFVTFAMLVRPALLKLAGAGSLQPPCFRVPAGFAHGAPATRREYIRVRLDTDEQGNQRLLDYGNQGSSILSSLSWADGLALLPVGQEVTEGDLLYYYPFSGILG